MATIDMLSEHLAVYKTKNQEYRLERSLKNNDIRRAREEMKEIAKQLSMGPIVFTSSMTGFQIKVTGTLLRTYVVFRHDGKRVFNKEVFLENLADALDKSTYPYRLDDPVASKAYASLILQLAKDSDIYDRMKKTFDTYTTAMEDLEELDENFWSWYQEVWEDLHDVATTWCANKENIKPGIDMEIINLKNYTSQTKQVWKLIEKDSTTKVVFKDNMRLDFPNERIGTVGTWVLSHPEYKPLLSYLRDVEDSIAKTATFNKI